MYRKELNIGDKFGEWTISEKLSERKDGYLQYKAICSCGTEGIFKSSYLISGKSEYCRKCSSKKKIPKGKDNKFYKHGAAMKDNPIRPTYKIWIVMRQRCTNENCKDYKNYGGRGIKVCDKWKTFEYFLKDMGICPKNFSLERINNNGNYCPENCKWASRKEQNNNRRDNIFFMINDIRVTRTQIQEKMNWTRDMYRRRSEKYGTDWIIEQYKSCT